jgi:single-strand DNA-binding protein
MIDATVITVVGNLTDDPELHLTANGPVTHFTVASTPRTFNRETGGWQDADTLFLRCSAWRKLAEHAAASLQRGTRVIARGRVRQRTYETKEGERRTMIECEVDEVGPSLRYATAKVSKVPYATAVGGARRDTSPSTGDPSTGDPFAQDDGRRVFEESSDPF